MTTGNDDTNVANNVAQANLQDLTEQWKKGELEAGMYYIKFKGSGKLDWWHGWYWEDSWSENVEEVLAPVPSYEEWKSMGKFAMEAMKVAEENQQLKVLLIKCEESVLFEAKVVKETSGKDSTAYKILTRILTKIDNAMGEKK